MLRVEELSREIFLPGRFSIFSVIEDIFPTRTDKANVEAGGRWWQVVKSSGWWKADILMEWEVGLDWFFW